MCYLSRPTYLTNIKSDSDGFLFNQTFGKTLRGQNNNVFAFKSCSNCTICPVANLRLYVKLADLMGSGEAKYSNKSCYANRVSCFVRLTVMGAPLTMPFKARH